MLLKFVQELDTEEKRALQEELDEESLAIFDLLRKPDLSKKEIKRVKEIAVDLLKTLKEEKLRVDHWREKEATRDAVQQAIHDFLYQDETGLPLESYTEMEVTNKSADVFRHIYRVYPALPSPFYSHQ
jgi:type I restriction enzyme R subunit